MVETVVWTLAELFVVFGSGVLAATVAVLLDEGAGDHYHRRNNGGRAPPCAKSRGDVAKLLSAAPLQWPQRAGVVSLVPASPGKRHRLRVLAKPAVRPHRAIRHAFETVSEQCQSGPDDVFLNRQQRKAGRDERIPGVRRCSTLL